VGHHVGIDLRQPCEVALVLHQDQHHVDIRLVDQLVERLLIVSAPGVLAAGKLVRRLVVAGLRRLLLVDVGDGDDLRLQVQHRGHVARIVRIHRQVAEGLDIVAAGPLHRQVEHLDGGIGRAIGFGGLDRPGFQRHGQSIGPQATGTRCQREGLAGAVIGGNFLASGGDSRGVDGAHHQLEHTIGQGLRGLGCAEGTGGAERLGEAVPAGCPPYATRRL